MFKRLKHWLKDRAKRKADKAFDNGYQWAAGSLLRGVSPDDIYAMSDCPFEDDHPFDHGARRAVSDWKNISPDARSA